MSNFSCAWFLCFSEMVDTYSSPTILHKIHVPCVHIVLYYIEKVKQERRRKEDMHKVHVRRTWGGHSQSSREEDIHKVHVRRPRGCFGKKANAVKEHVGGKSWSCCRDWSFTTGRYSDPPADGWRLWDDKYPEVTDVNRSVTSLESTRPKTSFSLEIINHHVGV